MKQPIFQKLIKNFVAFLQRFYLILIIACLALSAVCMPRFIHLFKSISTDPVDLLPANEPSVQTLLQIRDKADPKQRFALVFESENPENTKRLLEDLKLYLDQKNLGTNYIKKPGHEFFDRYKLLYVDLKDLQEIKARIQRKIQQQKLGGFYIDFEKDDSEEELDFSDLEEKYLNKYGYAASSEYYVSPNDKIFSLFVESKLGNLNIAQEKEFQEDIIQAMKGFDYKKYDPTMKMYFAGSSRVMEYRALLRDLRTAGIISGALIFLPLLLRFRKIRYVVLIFLPLAVGIPIGMALTSLWIPRLNVTTSFLFGILGGLGVETGIHLFSRYYEQRKLGASVSESLEHLYFSLFRPILTAVCALAVTFFLMIFSNFRGFSEFGFISGIGLSVIFILYFSFFPALIIAAEKLKLIRFNQKTDNQEEKTSRWQPSPAFMKTCLALMTGFTVFAIWSAFHLKFEYDTRKIRADDPREKTAKMKQQLTSGNRINAPAAILIHSQEEAEQLKKAVDELKHSQPDSVLDYGNSVYSLVPEEQQEKLQVIHEISDLLADDALRLVKKEKQPDLDRFKLELKKPDLFTMQAVPEEAQRIFIGQKEKPGSLFLIFAKPQLELDNGKNAIRFAEEIQEIKTPSGTYYPSSNAIVFANVITTMLRDSKFILIASIISVFSFVYLDFKNLKKTSIVMASILSGVLWVLAVMFLTHQKLNLYNMVMIPAVMGMSIDNSIHIYHRYEELGKGSLGTVLSSTGLSTILASLTNASGFVGLMFCSHGGLRSMGVLAVTGVVTCLMTTLFFLPLTLQFFEWRQSRKVKA